MSFAYGICSESNLPPRVYRTAEEVIGDIRSIAARIEYANRMFNVRELISDILEKRDDDIIKRAETCADAYNYAAEVLNEMRELYGSLECLKEELSQIRAHDGFF